MENLNNNTAEENVSGLIHALAIAFESAEISDVVTSSSIKIHLANITSEQFSNLHTIKELYKKDVAVKSFMGKICIMITDAKEVENGI